MKNSIITLVVMAALAFAGTSFAQNSATATGTASATVICPISFNQGPNDGLLQFGNIVAGTGTETIASTATGTPAVYNPTSLTPGGQLGTQGSAVFHVQGQEGFTYAITTPASVTVTNAASNTLTATLSASASTGKLSTPTNGNGGCDGTDVFYVGGTLTDATTASGAYTGTWSETVAYN